MLQVSKCFALSQRQTPIHQKCLQLWVDIFIYLSVFCFVFCLLRTNDSHKYVKRDLRKTDGPGYSNERVPLVTRLLMSRSLNCSPRPISHLSGSDPVKLKPWAGTKKHLKKFSKRDKGNCRKTWRRVSKLFFCFVCYLPSRSKYSKDCTPSADPYSSWHFT